MDVCKQLEGVSPNNETGAFNGCSPATIPDTVTAIDLVRMKETISNQCFEMRVQANLGSNKRLVGDDADISTLEEGVDEARTKLFNKTLALNRMQVWNAITTKLTQNDGNSEEMKMLAQHSLSGFGRIRKLQQESRELQDQITDLQKERLDLKVLIKKKMQEMAELKKMRENQGEAERRTMEKADTVVEKHQKIIAVSQNILRGILLATRVNWMDNPKLRDIAMGLESIPN
ncbi:centromere protein H [Clupea harengus]|uniref:Centromere protein H n=1 Tax=Clupea harengus TaxID=7950 RepID=A0A6P3VXR7_CLUHA|nr:centromere protein H [Clupea harengus]XP_042564198.1 centromere protein H [Clupea harengus]